MQLKQIANAAQNLVDALDRPGSPVTTPLEQMVRLQVLTEHLPVNMVARTKKRGASWEQIGAILSMNKDAARKKWSLPARRTVQRTDSGVLPAAPPGHPTTAQPPGPESTSDDVASPSPAAAAGTDTLTSVSPTIAHRDLATVLSSLQRASGLSLRALASRSNVSPSFLSRLMSGERFPARRSKIPSLRPGPQVHQRGQQPVGKHQLVLRPGPRLTSARTLTVMTFGLAAGLPARNELRDQLAQEPLRDTAERGMRHHRTDLMRHHNWITRTNILMSPTVTKIINRGRAR
ncbi:helix-turn-helix domain-containing protein [Streptomyces sp. NPDC087437]|uniref:helix-turn-helix domain-containing protein n=1 Tax=Streptomyces sp. NPDC087437 TaxID=3365789 RepID=UPI003811D36A